MKCALCKKLLVLDTNQGYKVYRCIYCDMSYRPAKYAHHTEITVEDIESEYYNSNNTTQDSKI